MQQSQQQILVRYFLKIGEKVARNLKTAPHCNTLNLLRNAEV